MQKKKNQKKLVRPVNKNGDTKKASKKKMASSKPIKNVKPIILPIKDIPELTLQEIELPKPADEVPDSKTEILQQDILSEIPAPEEEIKQEETPLQETPAIKEVEDFQDEKNRIEALLFACGRYMEDSELVELTGMDKKKVKNALEGLRKDYMSGVNSLMIFQEDRSWKINVREKYLPLVRKIISETEISRGVMETLAVIAWKSPVFQSEVVKIRGNKCYDHIEDLDNMGYISKDKKGRSYVLKTTDKFYTYFDIDTKNLQGVLDSAKKPEAKDTQVSLEEIEKPEEKRSIVDAINIKKKTESEEDRMSQEEFLHKIEEKIAATQQKNAQFEEELPKPQLQDKVLSTEEQPPIDSSTEEQQPMTSQPDVSQPPKPKSLTKKQLEKKFKEELMRVREKMEKK